MNPKLSPAHLNRRALGQVMHNQESQRRQYGLADHARQLGFHQVEVIDEDLGRSGSGQGERPGFEHLVAEVCTGQVGAVLCVEASQLARNGRDWHHLMVVSSVLCKRVSYHFISGYKAFCGKRASHRRLCNQR